MRFSRHATRAASPSSVARRTPSRTPAPTARRTAPTPEQLAKTVTDKRPSPPGLPDKAEIILRLSLPRAVPERLTVMGPIGWEHFQARLRYRTR
jgi:hypothetical protein